MIDDSAEDEDEVAVDSDGEYASFVDWLNVGSTLLAERVKESVSEEL